MTRDDDWGDIEPGESPECIRDALAKAVASDPLANAERLKSFLIYVVEESLAGRAQGILGKTIAQDVYGRDGATGEGYDNVVRVDARRLRRKLREYYEGDGASNPVRIHIDSGGYAPRFERQVSEISTESTGSADFAPPIGRDGAFLRKPVLWGVFVVGATVLVLGVLHQWQGTQNDASLNPRVLARQALAEKSAATVQAANLCDTARGMLFPIGSIENQKIATRIFQQAIASDAGYACGYAGAAHSLATLSLIVPRDDPSKVDYGLDATAMAARAIELDPMSGWSQSAAAWAAYSAGNHPRAEKLAALSVELGPRDGNVLDFSATIAILTGNFEEAHSRSSPERPRALGSYRFAHRNLHAVASFHLGDYETAIASLRTATQSGDPVSPLTLTFLAASHEAAGDHAAARDLVEELVTTWPAFRPDLLLGNLYADRSHVSQIVDRLRDAGWRRPDS